jgi:hypothetical protein
MYNSDLITRDDTEYESSGSKLIAPRTNVAQMPSRTLDDMDDTTIVTVPFAKADTAATVAT